MTTKYHKPDTTSSAYGPNAATSAAQRAAAASASSTTATPTQQSPAVSAEVGDISSRPVSGVDSLSPSSKPDNEPELPKAVVTEPEPVVEVKPVSPAVAAVIAAPPASTKSSTSASKAAAQAAPKQAQKTSSAATNAAVAATSGSAPSAPHQPPKRPGHKPQKAAPADGGLMSKLCCCFSSSEPEYDAQSRPQNAAAATASASSSTAYEPKVMTRPAGKEPAVHPGAAGERQDLQHQQQQQQPVDSHRQPHHPASSDKHVVPGGVIAGGAAGAAAGAAALAATSANTTAPPATVPSLDPNDAHAVSSQEPQATQVDKLADDSSAYELSDVIPAGAGSEFSSDPRYFAPSQGWLLSPVTEQLAGRKCLVLDLDETLVHSSFKYIHQADFVIPVEIEGQYHNVYVIKRPGVDEFMKRVGELYEVVVFTASVSKYGDPLLDQLDIHNVVHHRLFRESCFQHGGNYIKNLSQLGRPLKDVIIIDNSPASYVFHPQHAIPVSSWFSDAHDNELLDMLDFLEDMSKPKVEDVSLVLDVNM